MLVGAEGFEGGAAGGIVVEAADDGGVLLQIGEGAAEVGDGVKDTDVGGGELAVVLGEPGEEVEEAFEEGHGACGGFLREGAGHVDGGDASLRGALEAGGGLEGVAADVVGEGDVVVGLAELLTSHDDLLAVARGEGGGDAPGFAVLHQIRGMEVPDHQDAVG